MRSRILILLFLFLSVKNGYSQVPGYLGNRFSIGVQGGFFPFSALSSPSFNYKLSADFSATRKLSYFAYWMNSNSKYRIESYEYTSASSTTVEIRPTNEFNEIKIHSYGIGFKRFFGGYVSPIGKYFSFSIGVSQIGLRDWKLGLAANVNKGSDSYSDFVPTIENYFLSATAQFTFGKVVPVSNKLLIDFNINTQFVISSEGSTSKDSKKASWDRTVFGSVYEKYRFREIISVNLGLKYLIF